MDAQRATASSTRVYVACARTNEIAAFALGADGQLEPVQRVTIPAGVTPLAVDPGRRHLYAGLRGESPSVLAFAIDSATGSLTSIGSTSVADPPMYLALDASGTYLLSASYAAAACSLGALGDAGHVDSEPIARFQTPPRPHSILTGPTNRYLFVASLGGDAVLQYVFDAQAGQVVPNDPPFVRAVAGSGPRHMVFHPAAPVLYVNGELDASVCSYAVAPETGRLRAITRALMLPESSGVAPWAAELAIGPDGRYLYASERRTSTLVLFDLSGEPGALRRLNTVTTEEQPRSFAIEPRGRFLVVAGELSNHLTVYRVDASTGMLEKCYRRAVGEKPCWVTIIDLPPARS
jgi:6-phosphogluconolactonase